MYFSAVYHLLSIPFTIYGGLILASEESWLQIEKWAPTVVIIIFINSITSQLY